MSPLLDTLSWQFRMTWSLARDQWLPSLTDELLLWRQTSTTATMRQGHDGRWVPDWDEDPDPVPPASAGWLTWHISWWWSSVSAALDGAAIPDRQAVGWEPDAAGVCERLERLADSWSRRLAELTDNDLELPNVFPWAEPRPARFAVAWVNSELMKNVAELGDVIRLHSGHVG